MSALLKPAGHDHAAVTGNPLRWLKTEAAIELLAALLLFRTTHQSWWLAALFLVPDIPMLGYVGGVKIGAACYNVAHSQIGPILLCLAALRWHHPLLLALGLLWLAHIGLDRALAFGLKYDTDFQHTHLGGQNSKPRDRHSRRNSLPTAPKPGA